MRTQKYLDNFLERLNDTSDVSQKNLYTKEQYEKLMNVVVDVLKKNKHANISEIREELFRRSGLEQALRNFFLVQKKAPGGVIRFGTGKHQEQIVIGNRQEVYFDGNNYFDDVIPMEENTIFDLGSLTKQFTSVAILQLAGEGELSLADPVAKYLPEFSNIQDVTIFDLLTFRPLITDKRIDKALNKEEAEDILFNVKKKPIDNTDRYNDIAPMVLKYIVEKVSGLSYADYVKYNILNKAGMNNTFVRVPEEEIHKIANSNYSATVDSEGNVTIDNTVLPGIVTDKKAVVMGQPDGILSGHAGLFSTSSDMASFQRGLINGLVLHPALTREMAKNRTGAHLVRTANGFYTTSYGFLCNSKNPSKIFTDVHHGLSGSAFSQSGWPGTYMTVDPLNDINLAYLSNRTHNRITSLAPNFTPELTNKSVEYKGRQIIDASIYAWNRRDITDKCIELAIQEKMLEEILGRDLDKVREDVKVRVLK